jgi:hypothetical protein
MKVLLYAVFNDQEVTVASKNASRSLKAEQYSLLARASGRRTGPKLRKRIRSLEMRQRRLKGVAPFSSTCLSLVGPTDPLE